MTNRYGLHARASMRLSQLAKDFQSEIRLSRSEGNEEVDVKSTLGLLTLGAENGQEVRISVSGDDAEQAMEAILDLFERKFDEE
ncbi:MAG: HPr family phosphocarrier protein [Planctomycetota bacterium]